MWELWFRKVKLSTNLQKNDQENRENRNFHIIRIDTASTCKGFSHVEHVSPKWEGFIPLCTTGHLYELVTSNYIPIVRFIVVVSKFCWITELYITEFKSVS